MDTAKLTRRVCCC